MKTTRYIIGTVLGLSLSAFVACDPDYAAITNPPVAADKAVAAQVNHAWPFPYSLRIGIKKRDAISGEQ